jgi:phosphoenolpyruvate-protein kinase (PTS system EI component)
VLRGTTVAPGVVVGPAHRKLGELERAGNERLGDGEPEEELNRFRSALDRSRRQLVELRAQLSGKVAEDDARILDTHLAYLKDSAFIADVERQILEHHLRLAPAIAKVVADYERIFKLVQSERLRQGAVDLRDVGLRVLQNLEVEDAARGGQAAAPLRHVLVARGLSIVDLFNLHGEHVLGVVTEEGGLAGHAAIFARSMGIPTLVGVPGLLDTVAEGDMLLLDAGEGLLRVRPDPTLVEQYAGATPREDLALELDQLRARPLDALPLGEGAVLRLGAACGNLPEVALAARAGVPEIGLFRTELLFLGERNLPSRAALAAHYEAVIAQARGAAVTFRLLDADSGLGAEHLTGPREPNPKLGRCGVRWLLMHEDVLRLQCSALLTATGGRPLRVAVPFVVDPDDVRRVRAVLLEEQSALRAKDATVAEKLEVGAVIETPASLVALRDLAREADFLTLNLDAFLQHLLAADPLVPELALWLRELHPLALRTLRRVAAVAQEERAPLSVFGAAAEDPDTARFLVGAGWRHLCAAPHALPGLVEHLSGADLEALSDAVEERSRATSLAEVDGRSQGLGARRSVERDTTLA